MGTSRRGFFGLIGVALGMPALGLMFRDDTAPPAPEPERMPRREPLLQREYVPGIWQHMESHAALRHHITGEIRAYEDFVANRTATHIGEHLKLIERAGKS